MKKVPSWARWCFGIALFLLILSFLLFYPYICIGGVIAPGVTTGKSCQTLVEIIFEGIRT